MLQYYRPNRFTDIEPILLIPSIDKNTKSYEKMMLTISLFNNKFKKYCQKIKIIEFEFNEDGIIIFNNMKY